jgi:single-strand DNA-binding protein
MQVTTIIGNLGRDPDIRATKNGGSVANLAVAVNEFRGKDKDSITHWYSVVAWNQFAEIAESLEKGDRVVVVGKMQTRKWEDKEGNDRYTTELVVDGWTGALAACPAPETKSKSDDDDDEDETPRRKSSAPAKKKKPDYDDSIPF